MLLAQNRTMTIIAREGKKFLLIVNIRREPEGCWIAQCPMPREWSITFKLWSVSLFGN